MRSFEVVTMLLDRALTSATGVEDADLCGSTDQHLALVGLGVAGGGRMLFACHHGRNTYSTIRRSVVLRADCP